MTCSIGDLPEKYKRKSLINPKVNDEFCGKWSIVLSLLNSYTDREKRGYISKKVKDLSGEYNWIGVDFPLTEKGFEVFDKTNKDIGLIVYHTVGDGGKNLKRETTLYVSKNIEEYPEEKIAVIFNIWGHYLAVSNEKQFLYDGDKTDFEICRRCWNKIHKNKVNSAKKALENHLELCGKNECKRERFPEEGKNILEFKKFEAIVPHPISISFDFESILKKISKKKKETTYIEEHIPISFGINVARFDGKNSYTSHTGTNSPKIFVKKLEEIVRNWYKETRYPKKLKNVEKAKEEFEKVTHCWICGGTFEKEGKYIKVKDHNHYTGEFRGIAHNCCNLKIRRPRFIPIYAHNLSGYDSKLFFDELVGDGKEKITVIPKTNEIFISFSKLIKVGERKNKKGELVPITFEMRFIDFFKFQKASLDKLVKNIDDDNAFVNLRREFPEEEKFNLVKNKLIFPYSFLDSTQKLKEKLPPFEEKFWFNKLKNSMPDVEDYERVVKIMEVLS